jgi:hypothetical protein
MSYLNPHTHNLDGPDADGSLRRDDNTPSQAQLTQLGLDVLIGTDRPRIVCLCGSTRFKAEFEQLNRAYTLADWIVLAPGVFGHADGIQVTEAEKLNLDALHFSKIWLADVVHVVDPGGYVGESTRREIGEAERLGKPVRYLSRESVAAAAVDV